MSASKKRTVVVKSGKSKVVILFSSSEKWKK